jgi:glycosyltransferase involved in cell wall biosynthesis
MSSEKRSSAPVRGHRIVHLISGLRVGGAERTLQALVDRLSQRGFESVIITLTDVGEIGRELRDSGFEVIALNWRSGSFSPVGFIKLVRMLRHLKPQILQTWMYHADLIGALARMSIRDLPLIWNIRGTISAMADFPAGTRAVVRACAMFSNTPSAVVVNSEQGYQDHQALGYHPETWAVIRNGIDLNRFIPSQSRRDSLREGLDVLPGDFLVGCMARYHPKKGHYFLLQAFKQFAKEIENAILVLAGSHVDEANHELVGQIREHGLEDRVRLLGAQSKSDLFYPALDVLALPSQFGEGFPNVVAEAMACGVPCVATDTGDAAEIVGEVGEIASPNEIADFSSALLRMHRRLGGEGQELARAARKRIQNHFPIEAMVDQYQKLYMSYIVNLNNEPGM